MGSFVITAPYVLLNTVDLSTNITRIKISYGAEMVKSTKGGDTANTYLSGLIDWDMEIECNQDLSAGSVDDTLFGLIGSTYAPIEVRNSTDAVGATNPSYEGNFLVENYSPIEKGQGELATTTFKLKGTGTLTRATS